MFRPILPMRSALTHRTDDLLKLRLKELVLAGLAECRDRVLRARELVAKVLGGFLAGHAVWYHLGFGRCLSKGAAGKVVCERLQCSFACFRHRVEWWEYTSDRICAAHATSSDRIYLGQSRSSRAPAFQFLGRVNMASEGEFCVLDCLPLRHDVLQPRLTKIAKTTGQSGDLRSFLVRKLVPANEPPPPPVYVDGMDSLNLQKGDLVKFSQQGSIFTSCYRLSPISVPVAFADFGSERELEYLAGYFERVRLEQLRQDQIRDVYRTLSSEPLYLVFNSMYELPRISYDEYARAHAEFDRPERLYDATEIRIVVEMLQWANLVYRRGYTPQFSDFSVANPGYRQVAIEILQQVYVSVMPDNRLMWPYRRQLHTRLLDTLKGFRTRPMPWTHRSELWGVLQEGGCVTLGLYCNGQLASVAAGQFRQFCAGQQGSEPSEGLAQHCVMLDFASAMSPHAIEARVASAEAVVVCNAERYSPFALLEFLMCLPQCCGLLLLQFDAEIANDTVEILTRVPKCRQFKPAPPPLEFWPQVDFAAGPRHNYAYANEAYFGADAITEHIEGTLDDARPLSWIHAELLPDMVVQYMQARRIETDAQVEPQCMFVASCATAQRQVLEVMEALGLSSNRSGLRVCVDTHATQTPYIYNELAGAYRFITNPHDTQTMIDSHNLNALRQCECLLLGESRLDYRAIFYYTLQPIDFATLRRLTYMAQGALFVISSRENMYFPKP